MGWFGKKKQKNPLEEFDQKINLEIEGEKTVISHLKHLYELHEEASRLDIKIAQASNKAKKVRDSYVISTRTGSNVYHDPKSGETYVDHSLLEEAERLEKEVEPLLKEKEKLDKQIEAETKLLFKRRVLKHNDTAYEKSLLKYILDKVEGKEK